MKQILLSICGAVVVCVSGFRAQANTILLDAGPGFLSVADSNSNLGYDFTVGSTPLLVTALGLWDGPQFNGEGFSGAVGDGFVSAHVVGLWDNAGTLLAKATVLPGMSGTLIGEFRYSSTLTLEVPPGPLILAANTTYVLGAAYLTDDPDSLIGNAGGNQAIFDPAVSPGNIRLSGGSFSFPGIINGPGSFVGPNAIFSLVTNGQAVPEGGSALLLMASAMVVVVVLRWGSVKHGNPLIRNS